jgi:RNA polymerase sigma-70 factor (ECF subfamily)
VCQLAYIGVHRYWSEGRLREEPRRLLYRIAQRAAIDVLRSRGRRLRLFQRLQPLDDSSAWMGIELRDALDRLRPADAALVVLHTSAGLTYEELAALQGQTVGAVRSRLHRARAALRSKLRGE